MSGLDFRPTTARESLLSIRHILARWGDSEGAPPSVILDLDDYARAGLDLSGMENFELSDRLADHFAAALEVLREIGENTDRRIAKGDLDSLAADARDVMVLPPDIEAMVERRIGAPRQPVETPGSVRLELSDILIEGRAQVLRKMAVETKPGVRETLGEVDQLIQAMFERFAPERWAEELAKAEAAEATATKNEDKDAIEVMAKALAQTRAREWEDVPDSVKEGYRDQARVALEAYSELERERADGRHEVGAP